MLTSKELFEKIKEFEGCRLEAYQDAAGVWTIGYGHTHGVKKDDVATEYYAEEMLKKDIEAAERQVLKLGVCKYQAQLDALTDFVFNLGIGKLMASTLLAVIKAKLPRDVVVREFRKWIYAGGVKQPGLVKRRRWESLRYFEPSDTVEETRQAQLIDLKQKEREEQAILDSLDEKPLRG